MAESGESHKPSGGRLEKIRIFISRLRKPPPQSIPREVRAAPIAEDNPEVEIPLTNPNPPALEIEPQTPEQPEESSLEVTAPTEGIMQQAEASETAGAKEIVVRPANRIYFHATPMHKLPSIIQHGIVTFKKHATFTRDLFYATFFEEEYTMPVSFGRSHSDLSQGFALTIWKDAHMTQSDENAIGRGVDLAPSGELTDEQKANLKTIGEVGYGWPLIHEHLLASSPPTDFVGVVPITPDLKEILVWSKVAYMYNVASPDEIEARILSYLDEQGEKIKFMGAYTGEEMVHDIVARLQQDVLETKLGKKAKELSVKYRDARSRLEILLNDISKKESTANEPISKRFLQILQGRCKKLDEELRIAGQAPLPRHESINPYYSEDYEMRYDHRSYGGKEGAVLAEKIAKQFGIFSR